MDLISQNPSHSGVVTEGEVVVIQTIAPVAIATLKRKFKENIQFEIDYDNSTFKGTVFLTYIANLNLPCKIKFGSLESQFNLLKDYLKHPSLVSVDVMEDLAMNIVLAAYGKDHFCQFDPEPFIRENADIIDVWLRRLCALPTYALYVWPPTKEQAKAFPVDDDHSLHGINFVNLIKHELFPWFTAQFEQEDMTYNELLFNEYCFNGQNLFKFFADPNNPLFIGLLAMDKTGAIQELADAAEQFMVAAEPLLKGIEHVPSV